MVELTAGQQSQATCHELVALLHRTIRRAVVGGRDGYRGTSKKTSPIAKAEWVKDFTKRIQSDVHDLQRRTLDRDVAGDILRVLELVWMENSVTVVAKPEPGKIAGPQALCQYTDGARRFIRIVLKSEGWK